MLDPIANPMGLLGFEFVELVAQDTDVFEPVLDALGFVRVARHRTKDAVSYRQGSITFIVNHEADDIASCLGAGHGIGFRVKDAQAAYTHALEVGAMPLDTHTGPSGTFVLQGIGGTPLYLFDEAGPADADYANVESIAGAATVPTGHGLDTIEHVGHAVYGGRLSYWAALYDSMFRSRALRCFDIEDQLAGEGIRHIALVSGNLADTERRLHKAGVPLKTTGRMALSCRLLGIDFEFVQKERGHEGTVPMMASQASERAFARSER
jgi:4-hydroxyphenylpyruvate dioxygenase